MKLYALGALEIYDSLYDIEEVSMTIFQPRRENVSTWTIRVEDLKDWAEKELKPRAKKAYDGEGEYLPGEWCTFCRAAVKCRARAEEKLKLAQSEFKLPPLLTDSEIEEVLSKLSDLRSGQMKSLLMPPMQLLITVKSGMVLRLLRADLSANSRMKMLWLK